MSVNRALTWEQQPPPPGGVFVSADGRASVTVPVGQSGGFAMAPIPEGEWPDGIDGEAVLAG